MNITELSIGTKLLFIIMTINCYQYNVDYNVRLISQLIYAC